MLGKRSQMQRTLLEANGLSSSVTQEERNRIRDAALRSFRGARRMQTIAVVAWITHGILFVINFWRNAGLISTYYGQSNFGFTERFSRQSLYNPLETIPMITMERPAIEFWNYALYWLNGWMFLVAVGATVWWFLRDRAATTREYEYRLASLGQEEKREPEN